MFPKPTYSLLWPYTLQRLMIELSAVVSYPQGEGDQDTVISHLHFNMTEFSKFPVADFLWKRDIGLFIPIIKVKIKGREWKRCALNHKGAPHRDRTKTYVLRQHVKVSVLSPWILGSGEAENKEICATYSISRTPPPLPQEKEKSPGESFRSWLSKGEQEVWWFWAWAWVQTGSALWYDLWANHFISVPPIALSDGNSTASFAYCEN